MVRQPASGLGPPLPLPILTARPVFVLGMNGSGTTMLVDSLGRHPDLYSFPKETRVIPYLMTALPSMGDLTLDDNFLALWNRILNIPEFRRVNGNQVVSLPENWSEFPRNMASVLDAIFGYFAATQGKTRWCEKTPQHVQHIPGLHALFPEAKFIHVIRDGRDCAASFHRRWRRTPEFTIFRWKNVVSIGQAQGRELQENYIELKYEELTSNPEHWMRKVCDFLNIPFNANVLKSRHPQSEFESNEVGSIEPNAEKWRTYFTQHQLKTLEEIAGQKLAELGYTIVYVEGKGQPSKAKLKYWKLVDYLRQFYQEIISKLNGKNQKSWFGVLSLPIIAYKQSRMNRY